MYPFDPDIWGVTVLPFRSNRRKRAARLVVVAATLAATVWASNTVSRAATQGNIGFVSVCDFSHRAPDDPIVKPGQPGASHSHDFFGNVSTDAFSTASTLGDASGTCRNADDTAAYWVPSLYVDGQVITPWHVSAYYRPDAKVASTVQAFPAGLEVVAGPGRIPVPVGVHVFWYDCIGAHTVAAQQTPPQCSSGSHMRVQVTFPDCWNGTDLDSADHTSHLAYNVNGKCDVDHPVPLPRLTLSVDYPTTGGPGVTLASGSPATAHADFFNTWNQTTLENLVTRCINTSTNCGIV